MLFIESRTILSSQLQETSARSRTIVFPSELAALHAEGLCAKQRLHLRARYYAPISYY